MDLLVATPNALLKFQKEKRLLLSDLSHLVIDEADTLFDSSFETETTGIIKTVKIRTKKPTAPPSIGKDAQVTIVGATLSARMLESVDQLVPVSYVASRYSMTATLITNIIQPAHLVCIC